MITASEFARLLGAKRAGKGKWVSRCPSHPDKNPSLSIAEGRKSVVFKCMSQGCEANEILAAMGLTWKDVLGERDVTPEMRGRWKDEQRLRDLEHNAGIFLLLQTADKKKRHYWAAAERNTMVKIAELRDKLFPEEAKVKLQRQKVHAAIEKHGWDKLWDKFLSTERGKAADAQYGRRESNE